MISSPQQLADWDRDHVWHAFTQMAEYQPFLIASAQGRTLVDIHGKTYLDGVSSLWCNLLGHRVPELDKAIREQLDQVAHVTLLGMGHPTTARLARKLAELAPAGMEHVFFSDSGASAVEVALKLAFQYQRQRPDPRPAKTEYIALTDAYHGDTLGAVSVGGVARFHALFDPLLFPVRRLPAPDLYRLPPGVTAEQARDYYTAQLEQLLAEHHATIAAMIIEPLMQCAAGMLAHPVGYLQKVRELTQRYDVLLIADEVAVGCGRTGTLFACQQEQVAPDLLCLAKGLTGGYLPLAATLASKQIYQAFLGDFAAGRTFFHGHTYGGNPLGAAAALATLEYLETQQILENLPPRIDRLRARLDRIGRHGHVGDIRQRGMIVGIELVRDKTTRESFAWTERRGWRVCQRALEKGVWLRPLGNVVVIFPPLTTTLAELDQICAAVEESIQEEFAREGLE
ncbi:MAG: adenosylmethionine--8-amino-7-oxononanoate transaminase [Pirellulales bacterium]|nr:adenosylmethionine--8-amino-7-oxononanoate transaminase [Pirellulales bacterium]